MPRSATLLSAIALALLVSPALAAPASEDVPRTASGRPDLTGSYNAATLTPLQRPAKLGEKAYLTRAEAEALAKEEQEVAARALRQTDGDREAPPVGGAAGVGFEDNPEEFNRLGAGNVGGYNWFWIDRGSDAFTVDGKIPTSILIDPPNGRMPEMTPRAREKMAVRARNYRPNDGTAWWLEQDGPGPYDDPESLPMSERCMLGFTGQAPTLPSLYNNFKQIVQTDDYVVILLEMVHDARIVRINSQGRTHVHPPAEVKKWLGDSIGWWEGDTLVVETTNFRPGSGPRGGGESSKVTERFSRTPDGHVLYQFTVADDTVWTAPWTGRYLWQASDERVYEYACHEGNYSMGGILRGARLLEKEALAAASGGGE